VILHPTLRRAQRLQVTLTALLLVLLALSQFLPAFGARRALFTRRPILASGDAAHVRRVLGSWWILALFLAYEFTPIQRMLLRARRWPREATFETTLAGLPLTRLVRGIETRLRACQFVPEGPPPEAGAPRIRAVRPTRWIALDSYEMPKLVVEIELVPGEPETAARAVIRRRALPFTFDTGESDYDRALMEHILTGMPRREVADMAPLPVGAMHFCCLLAALVAAMTCGWVPPSWPVVVAFLIIAWLLFLPAAVQVLLKRHVSGVPLACAAALLFPCTAVAVRWIF
jgi:hypothetical protein